MENVITLLVLFFFLFSFVFYLVKNKIVKYLFVSDFKYQLFFALLYLANIFAILYCRYCNHCYVDLLKYVLFSVCFSSLEYLFHLFGQTLSSMKFYKEGKFDIFPMILSFSYFALIFNIIESVLNGGIVNLHEYESKMLIVLVYSFSSILKNFITKVNSWVK